MMIFAGVLNATRPIVVNIGAVLRLIVAFLIYTGILHNPLCEGTMNRQLTPGFPKP